MKNLKVWSKLDNLLDSEFPFEFIQVELQEMKLQFVSNNSQNDAKEVWICQTIIEIHSHYRIAFRLLKDKQYYQAWCELERIEIIFHNLKRHFQFKRNEYLLNFIEKAVVNLQVIFPYRLFASTEMAKTIIICSVCKSKISIRNSCGHEIGEIYDGEACYRIIEKADILGISLVEDPGNKYSVMFLKDPKTDEQTDHYNYDTIDILMDNLQFAYEYWDLEVSQRELTKNNFKNKNRNDICSCGSGLKYKKCCMNKIGEKYPHYEFLLQKPSLKQNFLTNTIKNTHY